MRTASSLATRLAFNHIDAKTVALLKEAREFVIPAMPAILDGFYDHVGRFAETNTYFRNREHMMHAKAMQLKHWAIILEGRFDADYEASVTARFTTSSGSSRAGISAATMLCCPHW